MAHLFLNFLESKSILVLCFWLLLFKSVHKNDSALYTLNWVGRIKPLQKADYRVVRMNEEVFVVLLERFTERVLFDLMMVLTPIIQ